MYYRLKLKHLVRDLPIVRLDNGICVAGFDSVGDTELIQTSADMIYFGLVTTILAADYIITTEVKGIPIAQEIAMRRGIPFMCLRKEPKKYLGNVVKFAGESITSGKNNYYLKQSDVNKLEGKSVLFIDDVCSTGKTLELIKKVCKKAKCNLLGAGFILRETGDYKIGGSQYFTCKDVTCYAAELLPLPDIKIVKNS